MSITKKMELGVSLPTGIHASKLMAAWVHLIRRVIRAQYVPLHVFDDGQILLIELEVEENVQFMEYCKKVQQAVSKTAKQIPAIDSQAILQGLRSPACAKSPAFTLGFVISRLAGVSCDLELRIKSSLVAEIWYCSSLWDSDTIQRLSQWLSTLLISISENPNEKLNLLSIVPRDEFRLTVHDWNNTESPWPEGYCIHEFFEQHL